MKINQIVVKENQQLDELSWQDVKTGAANTLGAIGKGIGGIASVPQGVARAVKAGYKGGVEAIGGPDTTAQAQPAQAQQNAAPATQGGQAQATAGNEPENVKYIQQQIDTKEKEIQGLKSQLATAKDVGNSTSKSSSNSTSTQNKAAGGLNDLTNAVKAGVGMGAAGQSLMSPKPGDDMQTIKDKTGKDHQYKKVGDKWMDMATNKEVDPATAAMLDKQKGATAPTQAQQQPQGQEKEQPAAAETPAQQQSEPGDFGFNTETGEKYNSAEEHDAGEAANDKARAAEKEANPDKFDTQTGKPLETPADAEKPAVWKNNRNPNGPAATSPEAAANQAAQAQQNPAVWKNNRAPEGTPASTSPEAAAATAKTQGKDVQARMANQLGAAPGGIPAKDGQPTATPNFGQQATGYGKTTYNAPTGGVPQQPAMQPTTGAKAVPQEPAAPAQTKQDQVDTDALAWFNQKQKARNQPEVSMDDWKQNYKGKPQGPATPAPQGVSTPAAPNFGAPPAAAPAQQTASAQADQGKPGFLQSKIKGQQPALAEMDFSAILAKRANIRL